MSNGFNPLDIFQWPFSGNVNQRITTPWFSPTINIAGDAAIEERVVTDVASYGKQIGWLSEIVLELAKKSELKGETVTRLEKAVEKIKLIKETQQQSRWDAAVDALDQLNKAQPKEYARLIKERSDGVGQSEADT